MDILLNSLFLLFVMTCCAGLYAHHREQSGDTEAFDRRRQQWTRKLLEDIRHYPSATFILIFLLILLLVGGLVSIDGLNKSTGRRLFLGTTLICAAFAFRLVQEIWPIASKHLYKPELGAKSFLLITTFFVTALAQSLSDKRIQELVGEPPGEFSSAGFALTGVYGLWLWLYLAALILSVFSVVISARFLFIAMQPIVNRYILQKPIFYSKSDRDSITFPIAILGFLFPAISIFGVLSSPWGNMGLQKSTRDVFVILSFTDSIEVHKHCQTQPGQSVRIVDDGDRVLIYDDGKLSYRKCSVPDALPVVKPLMR